MIKSIIIFFPLVLLTFGEFSEFSKILFGNNAYRIIHYVVAPVAIFIPIVNGFVNKSLIMDKRIIISLFSLVMPIFVYVMYEIFVQILHGETIVRSRSMLISSLLLITFLISLISYSKKNIHEFIKILLMPYVLFIFIISFFMVLFFLLHIFNFIDIFNYDSISQSQNNEGINVGGRESYIIFLFNLTFIEFSYYLFNLPRFQGLSIEPATHAAIALPAFLFSNFLIQNSLLKYFIGSIILIGVILTFSTTAYLVLLIMIALFLAKYLVPFNSPYIILFLFLCFLGIIISVNYTFIEDSLEQSVLYDDGSFFAIQMRVLQEFFLLTGFHIDKFNLMFSSKIFGEGFILPQSSFNNVGIVNVLLVFSIFIYLAFYSVRLFLKENRYSKVSLGILVFFLFAPKDIRFFISNPTVIYFAFMLCLIVSANKIQEQIAK